MRYLCSASLAFILAASINITHAEDAVKAVVGEATRAGFSELERQLIKKYLGEQKQTETRATASTSDSKKKQDKSGKSMPPGLAKRDSLPPGLAAQLKRNGTLPPGLARRELPAELEQQLPPVEDGYERTILEDLSVVLIEKASGRIADIISEAVVDNNL